MRNYLLICILGVTLLIAGNTGADENLSISLSFDQKDLSIIQFKGFDVVGLKDTVFPEDEPGTPMLPARYINILIPSGAEVTDVTAQAENEIVAAENLLIYPVQPPVPLSKNPVGFTNPDLGAYANTELKPLVQYTNTQKMRGLTFVPVRVNPVRLKGSTGEIFLAQKIVP